MARLVDRLDDRKIRAAQPMIGKSGKPAPRMLNDGKGLLLRIAPGGSKSWIYRYRVGPKKVVDIGLGRYDPDGRFGDGYMLKEARELAAAQRRLRRDGHDPLAERKAAQAPKIEPPKLDVLTFKQVAEKWIENQEGGWSAQHRKDVGSKFTVHVYPMVGDWPVDTVDDQAVLRILEPTGKWLTKTETMARTRSQVESVLSFAMAQGYRPRGDNPARWDGHLEFSLAKKAKVAKVENHAAMRWQDLPAYMAELRTNESFVARALEFAILTAARTGEALGATWAEVDLEKRQWTIRAERMKADRDHIVALSDAAAALLKRLPGQHRPGDLLFVGKKGHMANNSMTRIVEKSIFKSEDGRRPVVHGFRGTFKTWAKEHDYRDDVVEMALAHKSGDDVADRYTHTELLRHRTALARDWADYCGKGEPADAKVVPIRTAG
jgi:integrase